MRLAIKKKFEYVMYSMHKIVNSIDESRAAPFTFSELRKLKRAEKMFMEAQDLLHKKYNEDTLEGKLWR